MTERRIKALAVVTVKVDAGTGKALATVSAVDVGAARKQMDNMNLNSLRLWMLLLNSVQVQRRPVSVNYVPKCDTSAPKDLQEAADYYLTERGIHTNQMLMTSISTLASFYLKGGCLFNTAVLCGSGRVRSGTARNYTKLLLLFKNAAYHPGCDAHGSL
jgi:hypothetical protein